MARMIATIKRFVGDSSEGKPIGTPNGSTFLEKDTGDMYIYSSPDNIWHLKDEPVAALRLELIKRDDELLNELKKVNENLLLVIEAVDG